MSHKRPLPSSSTGPNQNTNNNKTPTKPATTSNNQRDGTRTDMDTWWERRYAFSFEGKRRFGGVKLNFNHWATNAHVTASEVQALIDHCLITPPPSQSISEDTIPISRSFVDLLEVDEDDDGVGLHADAVQRVVVLNIHGLDPRALEKHYDQATFFHNSSSVPLLCVQFPDIQKKADNTNPNAWFYNDVKPISSLLLWSKMNPTPATTLLHLPLSKLINEFRLLFEVQHLGGDTLLITQSDKNRYIGPEVTALLTTLLDALPAAKIKTKTNIEDILTQSKDVNTTFGGFYRIHSTDGGMFVLMRVSNASLRMVLIWDKDGHIDILDSVSRLEVKEVDGNTDVYVVEEELVFKTSITTFVNADEALCHDDKFQLSLKFAYERPGELSLSSTSTTVPSLNTTVAAVEGEEEPTVALDTTTMSTVSAQINVEEVLQRVSNSYQTLPQNSFEQFVLPPELLHIMGFMCEVEFSGCIHTSDRQLWSTLQLSADLLAAGDDAATPQTARSHHTTSSNNRFANLDLEDGEELDSDDDGDVNGGVPNSTKTMSKAAFQRVYQQATHFFVKDKDISQVLQHITLPLDMIALDCEMCSTKVGLELTRISLLHPLHGVLVDCLVKPKLDITDYHTEFSGVDEKLLEKITVKLEDVHELLRCLIGPQTILVGHSLDTDLKALQLVHNRIVDTAAMYPHPSGLPYKHQLKKLMKDVLQQDIQDGTDGHDSIQDSVAALELVIYKIQQYLHCPQQFEDEMMQMGLQLVNNVRLINGNQAIKYSYFEHLEHLTNKASLHVHLHSCPLGSSFPTWERDAMGYRDDANVRTAGKRFEVKIPNPKHVNLHQHAASNWKSLLTALTSQVAETSEQHAFLWGDIDLLAEGDTLFPSSEDDKEDEHRASKRRKSSDSTESKELSSFEQLNHMLELLYAAMPKHTLLLIPTQASLVSLRQLIAKKIRFKWDSNSGTRKKPKVALLKREKNHQRLQTEWDGNNDELALIEESHHAAEGILFMRLKR